MSEETAYQAAARSRKIHRRWIMVSIMLGFVLVVLAAAAWNLHKSKKKALLDIQEAAKVMINAPQPEIAPSPPKPALSGPQTTPVAEILRIGEVIGDNYRIMREYERGSLGQVYEAEDLTTRKSVILKRLRPELHRTDKDLDRLLKQARAVASFKHRNLAEIHSVFLLQERMYLAVEHVRGVPMSRFLEASNRISLLSAVHVMRQIVNVLDYMHGHNVLHGDLRPSNILVQEDGIVKVTDFGIGPETRKIASKLSWTESVGGPAYMAPEVELGTIVKESDIYSLALIFYEMITNQLPFQGPNFLAQKREMRYPPPSSCAQDIPSGLDAVMKKAFQPEPQRRYHTATDLLVDIEAAPSGPGRTPTPAPTPPR